MRSACRGALGPLVLAVFAGSMLRVAAQGTTPTPTPTPAQELSSPRITYRLEAVNAGTLSKQYSASQLGMLEKLNRRDLEHLARLKEMIVPETWPTKEDENDELAYGVLPATW